MLNEQSSTDLLFARDDDISDNESPAKNRKSKDKLNRDQKGGASSLIPKMIDMRHILGFLNQSEWVTSLNIGNIMQISPIQREDLTMHRRNEQEVSRDAFLETVSFYIVSYFCISTEIRFII
jgi:hypothetical protein